MENTAQNVKNRHNARQSEADAVILSEHEIADDDKRHPNARETHRR